MSTLDIRNSAPTAYDKIRFADDEDPKGTSIAAIVEPWDGEEGCIRIRDDSKDFVVLHSKEHVANLRKALDKAEELGWVK